MKEQLTARSKLSTGLAVTLVIISILVLASIFLFQRFNFLSYIMALADLNFSVHPYVYFIFNKTLRMIGNDLACMLLIYVFFRERKFLVVAWYLFLVELLVILPVYFMVKLGLEGDSELSSPLLSQFHRIIVNPVLMILLMVGFLYQRYKK